MNGGQPNVAGSELSGGKFAGHDGAWRQWHAARAGERMHHGWMIAGRKGTGKASFALAAARELVAEPGVPQPPGAHPDIIVLANLPASAEDEKKRAEGKPYQTKRNIAVDQIRAMQQRLNTRPTLGPRRVIIIDSADDLEKNAANALLKSLEEPPAGTFFLLVTHRPGQLLPTIRSRCRVLHFRPLSDAEIDRVLIREVPQADAAMREAAIAAAGGSPGAALEFVELDLGRMHDLMRRIARDGDPDFTLRGRLAEAMGARPERKRQVAAIDLARSILIAQLADIERGAIPMVTRAHAELARLNAEAPLFNYDSGLLIMEIGTLLGQVAASRDRANG